MKMLRTAALAMLLLPVGANAGVYVCVDPDTGKRTFTDKACPTKGTGSKLDVKPHNFGANGHRGPGYSEQQAWKNQRSARGEATYPNREAQTGAVASVEEPAQREL